MNTDGKIQMTNKVILIAIVGLLLLSLMRFAYADDAEAILDSSTGTSAFVIKDSAPVAMGWVDSDGNMVIKGGMRIDSAGVECTTAENLVVDGNMSIGTGTGPSEDLEINGNIILDGGGNLGASTTNGLIVASDGEPSLQGTAYHARKVTLYPEYPDAHLASSSQDDTASGNNTGIMISGNEMDSDTWRKYYQWNSDLPTLQDYYILVSWQVPSDFDALSATNAFQIDYKTENATNTNCALDFTIYKDGTATALYSNITDLAATSWTTETVLDSSITAPSADDTLVIAIQLKSKDDYYAKVGNIVINYLSKW